MLLINKGAATAQNQIDLQGWVVPIAGASDFVAVGAASAAFSGIGAAMTAGKLYIFTATTDCWLKQGPATPVASKGAGSMFVQKGIQVLIDGAQGPVLAMIQDVAGGNANLQQVTA